MVFDDAANLVLATAFTDSVDLGGGRLVSAGASDLLLASYTREHELRWSRRWGGDGDDQPRGIAADAEGGVYLTGSFESPAIDLGGGTLAGTGSLVAFLAKYDRDGAHLWSTALGGRGSSMGTGLVVDRRGNVFVTGFFQGEIVLGPHRLRSVSNRDLFLVKLSSGGVPQWAKRFGEEGPTERRAANLAVDAHGDILISGGFDGRIDFGGGIFEVPYYPDIFLVKLSGDSGSHLWSHHFRSHHIDGASVAAAGGGEVFLAGDFSDAINLGPRLLKVESRQAFAAKFSGDGALEWVQLFSGDSRGSVLASGVAADETGRAVVAGMFDGAVRVGARTLRSAGDFDILLSGLSAAGEAVWAKRFGGKGRDVATDIAVSRQGCVAVAGFFEGDPGAPDALRLLQIAVQ